MAIALKTGKHTSARVASRMRRQIRGRKKVSGTTERPRLVVTRSSKHIMVQLVDDLGADVARGPGDDEARTLRRAGDALAPTDLATQPGRGASGGVLAGLE